MNKCLLASIGIALCAIQSNPAQTPPPASDLQSLRNEMRQLKEDYEKRLQLLEDRLRQYEQSGTAAQNPVALQTPPPMAAVATNSAAAQAAQLSSNVTAAVVATSVAEKSREFAREQFQRDTESRDLALKMNPDHPFKERVEQVLKDFVDIGGYFRAGYGKNNEGGSQVGFKAPGALSKYRLGNEAENYGELIFGKNWYVPGLFSLDPKQRPGEQPSGPIARTQVRLSFQNDYTAYGSSSDFQVGLPEAWASIGNVWEAQPSMKFWAGNRFYRRHDIHIIDFYYLNMSGGGGGVEDIELPFGKLAFSWIGFGAQSGLYNGLTPPDPKNKAGFSKSSFDLRLYDVPVPLGKGEFALVYTSSETGYDQYGNTVDGSGGVGLSFIHTREKFLDDNSVNKFSLQIGTGPAKTFTSGYETYADAEGNTWILPDSRDSWRFRMTEHFIIQPSEWLSVGPVLLYQYTDYRDNLRGVNQWASFGVRPILHLSKYFNIAFEGGADYVDQPVNNYHDWLYKFTICPEVSLGRHFMSRPVIRVYATYAGWTSGFDNQVGGNDYIDECHGLSWGVQMESWW